MTESAFQAARSIMKRANYLRGLITTAKGDVAKWTKIEDVHRREGRISQADGAKKMLERYMSKLDGLRKKFDDLKFPDNNLRTEPNRCIECGKKMEGSKESLCVDCMY